MSTVHTKRTIDRAGHKYGRLTVVELVGYDQRKNALWECVCECGNTAVVASCNLSDGGTKSCGCLHRDSMSEANQRRVTHGFTNHPLFKTWSAMVARCHGSNPRRNYGGRGISVYPDWRDSPVPFLEWIEANLGDRPEGMSLDRIDVHGNYEPGNLRWADARTQNANRSVRTVSKIEEDTLRLFRNPVTFVLSGGSN